MLVKGWRVHEGVNWHRGETIARLNWAVQLGTLSKLSMEVNRYTLRGGHRYIGFCLVHQFSGEPKLLAHWN